MASASLLTIRDAEIFKDHAGAAGPRGLGMKMSQTSAIEVRRR
jgi:hypothetical protein